MSMLLIKPVMFIICEIHWADINYKLKWYLEDWDITVI